MPFHHHVTIIDGDSRRRAGIGFALISRGFHVEPLECFSELSSGKGPSGVLVVHDDGELLGTFDQYFAACGTRVPMIAYGEVPSATRVIAALRNGVSDYLIWPCASEDFVRALERAIDRKPPVVLMRVPDSDLEPSLSRLTSREREVLAAAVDGLPNKEIAQKLSISHRTVEVHRARALKKIGAKNISDAVGLLFGVRFAE